MNVETTGIGLRSGEPTEFRMEPIRGDYRASNVVFIRGSAIIPVTTECLVSRPGQTVLASGSSCIETTEHLLSAMHVSGIGGVEIHVSGPELPSLDAAAEEWCNKLAEFPRNHFSSSVRLDRPACVAGNDPGNGTFVLYLPPPKPRTLRVTSLVPFDEGRNAPYYWHTFDFCWDDVSYRRFLVELAWVPTYSWRPSESGDAFRGVINVIRLEVDDGAANWSVPIGCDMRVREAFGLGGQGPAQHKNLDLLGDVAVLAYELNARIEGWIIGVRHGHQDTHQLLKVLSKGMKSGYRPSANEGCLLNALREVIEECRNRESVELQKRPALVGKAKTDYGAILEAID